ncbi:hypothetical protein WKY82_04940 [Gordonia malaquae]|uniref:Integral membrane protein n=1 Tax=Gordonia malaquae NBRC 108250 TaxID=1223542 RepID=M3V9L2_GORML|nr:hypothetical protein [Gordonia malaquae]GAC78043.1 hypothetical protein GM1_002_00210 [Gordonia malaquae NBRC 108250]
MSSTDPTPESAVVPSTLRWAGWAIAAEGLLGLIVAVVYVVREATGHHEESISGYGTAVWFTVIGGAVMAGGIGLSLGKRWGRAIGVMAQILLLPVAYALLTSSNLPSIGAPVGIVALGVLGLLFSPPSLQWLNAESLPPDAEE